jgi:hypothetical protein
VRQRLPQLQLPRLPAAGGSAYAAAGFASGVDGVMICRSAMVR